MLQIGLLLIRSPIAHSFMQVQVPATPRTATPHLFPAHDLRTRLALWAGESGIAFREAQARRSAQEQILDWLGINANRPIDATEVLDLSNLGLRSLPPGIEALGNLRELNLSGNSLTEFPLQLRELRQLKVLDLSDNTIREVPDWIDEMASLERISLRKNALTAVPVAIASLQYLRDLDLSKNFILALPPQVLQLPNLLSLNLNFNKDIRLPEQATGLAESCDISVVGCDLKRSVLASLRAAAKDRRSRTGPLRTLADRVASAFTRATSRPRARSEVGGRDRSLSEPAQPKGAGRAGRAGSLSAMPGGAKPASAFVIPRHGRDAFARIDGALVPEADHFFEWLDGIPSTLDERDPQARKLVMSDISALVAQMHADPALRQTCFRIAAETLDICDKRPALGFFRMNEEAIRTRGRGSKLGEEPLIQEGMEAFVLRPVHKYAAERIARAAPAPARQWDADIRAMAFLQASLRAHLAPFGIRVPEPAQAKPEESELDAWDADLPAVANTIRARYQDGRSVLGFLEQDWQPLAAYVDKSCAEELAPIEAHLEGLRQLAGGRARSSAHVEERRRALEADMDAVRKQEMHDVLTRNFAQPLAT